MLDPEYLASSTLELEKLFADLEITILESIAERIKLNDYRVTSTAAYELQKLRNLGTTRNVIEKEIAKILEISQKESAQLIEDSVMMSIDSDNVIFKEAFKRGLIVNFVEQSEDIMTEIKQAVALVNGDLKNICQSTAKAGQDLYIHACDKVYLAVQSGLMDYNRAYELALKELAREGVEVVQYQTGAKRKIDSAVRTSVRTGINKTAAKCQELNFDIMGGNLVEVTSHLGARPDHQEWQGKIYWKRFEVKPYRNFESATGYGTGAGLAGWNCRHSFFPYFKGLSNKVFTPYRKTENNELYELTQKQRYFERQIREWDKRNKVAIAGTVDNSTEKAKLTMWRGKLKQLLADNPELKRQYAREKAII